MSVPLPPSLSLPPSPSLCHISSLALLPSFFPLRFCRSRELSYSANEFGAAYLTGVGVFSIPFTNVTTYEGCRGCEGLEDIRATKVCNNCGAAHGKPARYVSFTIKMNVNGIHYTTAWRGKSATLYVLQYLDQSDMNDTLSVDDAIRQAFPKGQKLDIIVWYRTHISSEGIQCPVNVLHVVLSRPENHPSWPVHQLAVFNDTVAYSKMPELATPSQPAQVAMYVPPGLSAGGQVCGSNALLQVINATPLLQQFLLQLRNTGSPLRRALLKCLREMQGGAAPGPEHVRVFRQQNILRLEDGQEATHVPHMWGAMASSVPLECVECYTQRLYRCPRPECNETFLREPQERHYMLKIPHEGNPNPTVPVALNRLATEVHRDDNRVTMTCAQHGHQRQAGLQYTLQFHAPNNVLVLARMAGDNVPIPATLTFAGADWRTHGVVEHRPGHYVAYARLPGDDGQRHYLCDDAIVSNCPDGFPECRMVLMVLERADNVGNPIA